MSREEVEVYLKQYPDFSHFIQENGVRRLFVRAYMKLDKKWVDQLCVMPQLEIA